MDERLLIDVARLDHAGEDFSGTLDDAILELADDKFLHPFAGVRYDVSAQVLGSELLVRGTLAQDFETVCSRCGADFDFTVTVPDFTASFEVAEKTEFVDLTDEIRQCIILALPTYPVCRPDCRGICPTCGKNLNEGSCGCAGAAADSRWGALDALDLENE